ncbi:MAG: hypothetical protein AAGA56_20235 [Myxococcota bacterium]
MVLSLLSVGCTTDFETPEDADGQDVPLAVVEQAAFQDYAGAEPDEGRSAIERSFDEEELLAPSFIVAGDARVAPASQDDQEPDPEPWVPERPAERDQ